MKHLDLTNIEEKVADSPFNHLARLDNIYIGSMVLTEQQVSYLKALDVRQAIDLKSPDETPVIDKDLFEAEKIAYTNIPVNGIDGVSFESLTEVYKLLETEGNKFIYCASGNRVGAFLALLLSLVEGHPKKRAFEIGKRVGMCRETTQEQVLGKLQLSF